MEKYIEAGKIVNTHGTKGEVRIFPWVDSAEYLSTFKLLYIDGKPVKLLSGRVHKKFLLAILDGVDNINAAMALKNKTVYIDRDDANLDEGEFFLQDIIGAAVWDEEGSHLGKLTDVLRLPSGNVYVVTGEREIMIPAVPQFIIKTDVQNGIITVRLIEGM